MAQNRFETLVEVGKYTRPNGDEARGTIIQREDGALFVNIHPWFAGTNVDRWFPSKQGMGAIAFDEMDNYYNLVQACNKARKKVTKELTEGE